MANDKEWQRRSDEWVHMLEQSRLRKEKCLADKKSAPEPRVKKSIQTHVRKPVDTT